jgi:hypothetical protein
VNFSIPHGAAYYAASILIIGRLDGELGETSYLCKANAMGALRATTNHGGVPSGVQPLECRVAVLT